MHETETKKGEGNQFEERIIHFSFGFGREHICKLVHYVKLFDGDHGQLSPNAKHEMEQKAENLTQNFLTQCEIKQMFSSRRCVCLCEAKWSKKHGVAFSERHSEQRRVSSRRLFSVLPMEWRDLRDKREREKIACILVLHLNLDSHRAFQLRRLFIGLFVNFYGSKWRRKMREGKNGSAAGKNGSKCTNIKKSG